MKKVSFLTGFIILSLFGIAVYFSACNHNACVARNVVCQNNGTCRDGDCICSSGYEGDSCQFRVNEKFDSYYACIRTGLINDSIIDDNDDTLHIVANNDKFGITFFSIRDSIVNVFTGTVNGNYITVPEQTILTDIIYGNGSLNNGVLTITLYRNWPIANSSKTTYVGYKFVK